MRATIVVPSKQAAEEMRWLDGWMNVQAALPLYVDGSKMKNTLPAHAVKFCKHTHTHTFVGLATHAIHHLLKFAK